MRYKEPKLVFERSTNDPLRLRYANAYYPGCFTPTGITYDNKNYKPMLAFCEQYGIVHDQVSYSLVFKSEEQLFWFMLHWQ